MSGQNTPVRRFMTVGTLTVAAETPVSEAASTLMDEDVGSLVVVDERNRPVGMFTTTDLAEVVANGTTDGETVAEYMTDDVVTVGVDESLSDAAARMLGNRIHHLPVTDEEGVVGMLSTMDLTAYYAYTTGTDMT